ncbi:MAG: stage II sporulation protein M [Myxococcales bacterium]
MAEPLPAFVQRRRPGWERLGSLLDALERGPLPLDALDELDRLYRRAGNDLAYANTFFPASDAALFLNELCARAHRTVYVRRARPLQAFLRLFREDFPRAFVEQRRFFFVALTLFGCGALAGLLAAAAEPAALDALVDDALRQHLADGTLWTDRALAAATPLMLGSQIATNNLGVALTAFALGLTFGVGTAAVLVFNGLHLGAILGLCFRADLGWRLLSFVAAHGFVEIGAILLAAQGGLVLGGALIDPGPRTRGEALRQEGRAAVNLLLGTLPLFLVIGMVEGFVSPGDAFPPALKLLVGASLGALLFGYLVRFGRTRPAGRKAAW